QLAGIWAQLLGIKAAEISATANFFTLGGHSLLTIRLVSEIQRCYGVDISLQQVFNAKDLRSLANDIE
ncbi:acyl carrier protein, partial [Pseudoalteromonas sp. B530]